MAGNGFRIPSWIFYLSLLVFVAAIVITIALPVTFAKQDEGLIVTNIVEMEKTAYVYRHTLIEPYDPLWEEDPFEIWNVGAKAREAYSNLDLVGKIGQLALYAYGDASGPSGGDGKGWGPLIQRNGIGSLINVESIDERRNYNKEIPAGGIPILYGFDTIHGYYTQFPVNLGMAAAWSPAVIKQYTNVAAQETLDDGVPWTFGPMVDLGRDLRWGRVMESGGEDPFLSGTLSRAFVEGFQEKGVAATIKHFAGYGFPEAGVDYTGAHIDEAQLFNDYMRTGDIAMQDEDHTMDPTKRAWTVMAAFNLWDGIPCHGNRRLLTDVLRGHYNWTGFVVADYLAVEELEYHGITENCEESGRLSLYAGVDMNMHDGCHSKAFMNITIDDNDLTAPAVIELYDETINSLAPDGNPYRVHIELAARRVIAIKDKLGLFDNPLTEEEPVFLKDEYLQAAQDVAEKTMVLLENKDDTLPLPKVNTNRIVMAGRIPQGPMDHVGFWFGKAMTTEGYSAIRRYTPGLEQYLSEEDAGTSLNLDSAYLPGVRLMIAPQPEAVVNGHHDAEIAEDEEAHRAFGEFLRSQIDAEGQGVTHVLAVVGENVTMNGESASRAHMGLGGTQLQLLQEIVAIRKELNSSFKIVEVINAARPQVISDFELENMDAIMMAWCPGTKAGDALPRVLFGDVDFSGKTPMTWPRNDGQIPIYYSRENSPRGPADTYEAQGDWQDYWEGADGKEYPYTSRYFDSWNSPLYPFGYGKHYATHTYSDASLSPLTAAVNSDDAITAKVTVTRSDGSRAGAEIVQVYMSPTSRKPAPPKKKLIGFERVEFAAGETVKSTEIEIPIQRHFSYFDNSMKRVVDPGNYTINIADDSTDPIGADTRPNWYQFTFELTS